MQVGHLLQLGGAVRHSWWGQRLWLRRGSLLGVCLLLLGGLLLFVGL